MLGMRNLPPGLAILVHWPAKLLDDFSKSAEGGDGANPDKLTFTSAIFLLLIISTELSEVIYIYLFVNLNKLNKIKIKLT